MSTRRILSSTTQHSHQIPLTIRNSLHWTETTPTHSNPPFLPKSPSILATNLIKSYFEKCKIREARTLFNEMPERDVVAWTAMITGYTSCNLHSRAWTMFCEMVNNCHDAKPNEFTFSSALKTCKVTHSLSCGTMVHALVVKYGIHSSMYVENALLDMYATCCSNMDNACSLFRDISVKNTVSWTTLITGFTHRGDGYGGIQVFKQMLLEEVEPNPFSFSIAARACASIGSSNNGKQIHALIIKNGFESSIPVMNSILDMYCRSNSLIEANKSFNLMEVKDLITWNTLISGYEKFNPHESLNIYTKMELKGITPNCFTFTTIIAAISNIAVLACGEQVHGSIIHRGLEQNLALANALIDMYAKCGNVLYSRKIFNEMPFKNLVSWTSMMIGYGSHGYGNEAVFLFDKMVMSGIKPDRIVFMAVLGACSHAGLVNHGLKYFKSMVKDYNIKPDQEIYGCVVDLLGRAGKIEEAYELMEGMPFIPDESVWGAFLGACKAHKVNELVTKKVLDMRPKVSGTYIMLSNIYAAEGKWGEFAKIRKMMRRTGSKKEAGISCVEVRNQVYSFVAGDKVGSHIEWVYEVLDVLIEHMNTPSFLDSDCL